ncbi:hypothetical protein EYF80_016800 [Liparis tanakae]|uniref:Uncharacterized protein n=1 Tax=Liparis tanakae TaxID=230148 RepID=A0A4Z2I5A3_9TELE|nr:hypothetical protein EYF80_016800 [Liparis tanakae]
MDNILDIREENMTRRSGMFDFRWQFLSNTGALVLNMYAVQHASDTLSPPLRDQCIAVRYNLTLPWVTSDPGR